MSLREEQCKKVCRILDDVLANRPTERDSLIVAVRKAFKALEEPHWIPCSEMLPEEEDSIFARYYGTDRWRKSMFRKRSREVIATSVFENGELHTEVAHTTDGEWHVGVNVIPRTVLAWMPLPKPYKEVTE
jgi:hypothetical protein